MLKRRVVAITLAMSVWPSFGFAQAPQNDPLTHRSSRQVLEERGLGTDPTSLKVALKSSDAYIRGVAAMELATDSITDAIPDMESALATETDRMTRIKLTGSIAMLQPKDDNNIAIKTCRNSALDQKELIGAAQAAILFLPAVAVSACVPNLMMILKDSINPWNQAAALSWLTSIPFFSKLPEPTKTELRSIEMAFLSSSESTRKMAAIQALSINSSKEARDALAKAAETETDPGFLHLMEDVVKKKDMQMGVGSRDSRHKD